MLSWLPEAINDRHALLHATQITERSDPIAMRRVRTTANWPSAPAAHIATTESFEQLFSVLADRPDERVAATVVEGE